jgi:hypothetical protein
MLGFEWPSLGLKRRPEMDFEPGGVIFGTKPFSSADENILKQGGGIVLPNKRGMIMQFIFELIWTQSRSRYLAAMGQPEAED